MSNEPTAPTGRLRLGVDIGGTTVVAALIAEDGRVVASSGMPTSASTGADTVLDNVAMLVDELVAATSCEIAEPIGVGSAGMIDSASGRVLEATDAIAGWAGTDLAGSLSARLGGRSVRAINDVAAFVVGEMQYGAARGHEHVLAVTVGTGIGGAVVHAGGVLTGAHGAAGHIGHVPDVAATGLPCPCGAVGHVEAVASGPAMLAGYRARGGAAADLREVVAATHEGDRAAHATLCSGAESLGRVIGGLVAALDPSVVVVGGGVAQAGEVFLEPLRATVRSVTYPRLRDVPVLAAELGTNAVAVGAAVWSATPAEVLS